MKIRVYVMDLEIPARVKAWGLRVGTTAAVLVAGGVAFAGLPGGYVDGQPLTAAELTANFSYLQTEITSLQDARTVMVQANSAYAPAPDPDTDLEYPMVKLTLPAGTWVVQAFASLSTTMSTDVVQLGLYDDTADAEVPNSRSGLALTPAGGLPVLVSTSALVTVLTSPITIGMKGYRNGASTLAFGTAAAGVILADEQRMVAVQIQ